MSRPVTLFTGQWADLPLATLAKKASAWGYDGLELACWGDHLDVNRGAVDKEYCKRQLGILKKYNLKLFAISNHLAGQLSATRTTTAGLTASPRPPVPGTRRRSVRGRSRR